MEASLARLARRLWSHGVDLLALNWVGSFLDVRGIFELIVVKVIQIVVSGHYVIHAS